MAVLLCVVQPPPYSPPNLDHRLRQASLEGVPSPNFGPQQLQFGYAPGYDEKQRESQRDYGSPIRPLHAIDGRVQMPPANAVPVTLPNGNPSPDRAFALAQARAEAEKMQALAVAELKRLDEFEAQRQRELKENEARRMQRERFAASAAFLLCPYDLIV